MGSKARIYRKKFLRPESSTLPSGALEIFDLTNPGSAQTIAGLLGAYNLIRGATTATESTDFTGNVWDGSNDFGLLSPAITLGSTYTMMAAAMFTSSPAALRVVLGTDSQTAYVGMRNTNLNVLATCNDGAQKSKDGSPLVINQPAVLGEVVTSGGVIRAVTNGVLTGGTAVGTIASRTLQTIGRNGSSGTLYWQGPIYLVVVWNRELTSGEVRSAYRWMRNYLAARGVGLP